MPVQKGAASIISEIFNLFMAILILQHYFIFFQTTAAGQSDGMCRQDLLIYIQYPLLLTCTGRSFLIIHDTEGQT